MGDGARRVRPVSTPKVAERRGFSEKEVLVAAVFDGGPGREVVLEA